MKWEEIDKNDPVKFAEMVSLIASETGFTKADTRIFLKGLITVFKRLITLEIPISIGGFIRVKVIRRKLSENTMKNLTYATDVNKYLTPKQIVAKFPRTFRHPNKEDIDEILEKEIENWELSNDDISDELDNEFEE
ncbi:MAG: hypothetical protein KatS3mg002_1070 [Candidatus Woesearchaeota archaeon]|jgi:hypothetical protein|nr:MAG: hypothetical protein KatS3mg002_1070 [Candidatus Woesearchaeota archaeon]